MPTTYCENCMFYNPQTKQCETDSAVVIDNECSSFFDSFTYGGYTIEDIEKGE